MLNLTTGKRIVAVLAIGAIGAFGAGCGGDDDDEGDSAATTTTEETTTAEDGGGTQTASGDAAAGEQVFTDNCASCHGEDGSGGQGPSLQNPDLDEARVTEQVTKGGGGMPAFGDQLDEQQISDVAAYVVEEFAQGS